MDTLLRQPRALLRITKDHVDPPGEGAAAQAAAQAAAREAARRSWTAILRPAGTGYQLNTPGARAETLTTTQALSVALADDRPLTITGPLRTLVERVRAGDPDREPYLNGVRATLRPYQSRGVAWLQWMSELGLGALLADDMGLGKTLQTIALLAGRAGDRPHLVVCPMSVLGNWEREVARFAPGLRTVRHHGPGRGRNTARFRAGVVVVTTYALLRLDEKLLAGVDWDVVVLDEAQTIKNHTVGAAKAARRLASRMRVGLTGTPVENRLLELWAIMDFLNPGLLGAIGQFHATVSNPIEKERNAAVAERLRRTVAPFMLRREKTDPAVAGDLPPKIEQTQRCQLTEEQEDLYAAAVDHFMGGDLGTGIARRGRVLAMLSALKQICNHPAQFRHQAGPLAGRSGKLDVATGILADVVAAGDRALVFTQYREMGELLSQHFTATFGGPPVPFLHGGVSRGNRDRMVSEFQTDPAASPILIISIKAGGTGLNLTRANAVVHYDRWWNPAVEDQATDRAYRIGQTSVVWVDKLVTTDTLEERIADMLEKKRALADSVVGPGEMWLADLDDDALRALVALPASRSVRVGVRTAADAALAGRR